MSIENYWPFLMCRLVRGTGTVRTHTARPFWIPVWACINFCPRKYSLSPLLSYFLDKMLFLDLAHTHILNISQRVTTKGAKKDLGPRLNRQNKCTNTERGKGKKISWLGLYFSGIQRERVIEVAFTLVLLMK